MPKQHSDTQNTVICSNSEACYSSQCIAGQTDRDSAMHNAASHREGRIKYTLIKTTTL